MTREPSAAHRAAAVAAIWVCVEVVHSGSEATDKDADRVARKIAKHLPYDPAKVAALIDLWRGMPADEHMIVREVGRLATMLYELADEEPTGD